MPQLRYNIYREPTYDTLMFTLTPGPVLSLVTRAAVLTVSTRVAVRPPCRDPPLFKCSSSSFNSQTHLPADASTTDN